MISQRYGERGAQLAVYETVFSFEGQAEALVSLALGVPSILAFKIHELQAHQSLVLGVN